MVIKGDCGVSFDLMWDSWDPKFLVVEERDDKKFRVFPKTKA